MHYVIIHGRDGTSPDRDIAEYVEGIVYGAPKITAVRIGDRFVALCEYGMTHGFTAMNTVERMGSFPYGAAYLLDREIALREFGCWAYQYAPSRGDAAV